MFSEYIRHSYLKFKKAVEHFSHHPFLMYTKKSWLLFSCQFTERNPEFFYKIVMSKYVTYHFSRFLFFYSSYFVSFPFIPFPFTPFFLQYHFVTWHHSHLLRIGPCLACVYRVRDARVKLGEHERSVWVARGQAKGFSSFSSTLPTSQVHP